MVWHSHGLTRGKKQHTLNSCSQVAGRAWWFWLLRWGADGRKKCEGEGDVVGVKAPLGGVAQVIFHGVQVVEVGVQVRVHQDRGVEEDGEGQVEVEREEDEVRENRTSWMACR